VNEIFGPNACGAVLWWAPVASLAALVLAVPSVVMALARSPKALRYALVALAMSAIPLGVGLVARNQLREKVDLELRAPGRTAQDREYFRIAGYHSADDCLLPAKVFAMLPAMASSITIMILFYRWRARVFGFPE
jgi:hypothetical protein